MKEGEGGTKYQIQGGKKKNWLKKKGQGESPSWGGGKAISGGRRVTGNHREGGVLKDEFRPCGKGGKRETGI